MRDIVLIAHDIRSAHNVGGLLRTAEGIGVARLWLTGYTPYPQADGDARLPHEAQKVHRSISKTSLGAETTQAWSHSQDVLATIELLKSDGYKITALEQAEGATPLPDWQPTDKVAIVLGREVEGISPEILELCDEAIEIPMAGHKESYNVLQAAAMALYHAAFL